MGRVKKVTVKKEVPAGNNSPRVIKHLKDKIEKLRILVKMTVGGGGLTPNLRTSKRGITLMRMIGAICTPAIDCVNVSIPKYMSYLLPLAINKIVPGPFAGVAYDVASETVVPYIVDKVIPNAVDSLLSEETRTNIAIEKSLRERRPSEFSEIDL